MLWAKTCNEKALYTKKDTCCTTMPGARPKLLTGTVDAKHISVMHCGCANSNVVCLQLGKQKHVHDEQIAQFVLNVIE